MARWLAMVGMAVAAAFMGVPAAAAVQEDPVGADGGGITPPASLALSGIGAVRWSGAWTIDRTLLPAPLQPRLGAAGARRTLDSTNIALGDFEITFAGGRGRPRPDYALTSAGQRRERRRAWALVSQLNWAADRSNVASLGVSESIGKVNSPYALGTGRTNSQVTTGAMSWSHEDAWVLTFNWQRTQGGGGRGIHRLAELAAGAPLSASGVSLTLASQPLPLGMRSTLTFGGLVSSDRLRQKDQEALDLNSAERTTGRLFMRVGF